MVIDAVPLMRDAQSDAITTAWAPWREIDVSMRERLHEKVMKVLREKNADRVFLEGLQAVEAGLKAELKEFNDHHMELHGMVTNFMTFLTVPKAGN